jgi:hypothetical protein
MVPVIIYFLRKIIEKFYGQPEPHFLEKYFYVKTDLTNRINNSMHD